MQLELYLPPSSTDILESIDELEFDQLVYLQHMTGVRLLIAAHGMMPPHEVA